MDSFSSESEREYCDPYQTTVPFVKSEKNSKKVRFFDNQPGPSGLNENLELNEIRSSDYVKIEAREQVGTDGLNLNPTDPVKSYLIELIMIESTRIDKNVKNFSFLASFDCHELLLLHSFLKSLEPPVANHCCVLL